MERGRQQATPGRTLAVLIASVLAFAFQQTAILPVIPTVQQDLHASAQWSAWLLSGYLIASTIATPVLGKLGDRNGKRLMLLVSLGVFAVGSLGAMLAINLTMLVLSRVLQGAGGAVFPLSLAIAREQLPAGRVPRAVARLTATFGLGGMVGFGLAGLLVRAFSWRAIFGVGVVLFPILIILVALLVNESAQRTPGSLDLPGTALLTGGLVLILIVLTEGSSVGWASGWAIAGLVLAVMSLAGWVFREFRVEQPLLDLHVLRYRPVALTNAATFGLGYLLFGVYFIVPFLVTEKLSGGVVLTGLYLVPAAAGQALASAGTPAVRRRLSPRWTFTIGMGLATAGAVGLTLAATTALLFLWTAVIGVGVGFAIAVSSTIVTQDVPAGQAGIATSLNSVIRRFGGGIAGQISALLLAGSVAGGGTYRLALALCAGLAGSGALLCLGLPGGPTSRAGEQPSDIG